jgi:chromate transport protein ChrA
VTFLFGLLLWAVPPVPQYLLLVPLAWALNAAPPNMATGVEADYGMLVAAVITTGWVIWRDRAARPAWHTVTAGLLFALMIAWSGHDDVLIALAVVLLAAVLVRAITGHLRPPTPVQPLRPS